MMMEFLVYLLCLLAFVLLHLVDSTKLKRKGYVENFFIEKTMTTTTSQSSGVKKKRKKVPQKQSVKSKSEWARAPTSDILLEFIKDTFASKVKKSSQLPINDFFNHYNVKLDSGWIEPIVGNLAPFITFLSSSSDQNNDTTTAAAISFFGSKLNEVPIQSNYQQTKQHLAAAVNNCFNIHANADKECHPIIAFLNFNHKVNLQYSGDDWFLHLIGSKGAGKKRKEKLVYNVRIIATILYSIVCNTRDNDAVDKLACCFGIAGHEKKHRRSNLNKIAQGTIQEYFEIQHTCDDATATTASLSQSSNTNTSESNGSLQAIQAPPAIITNNEINSRGTNNNVSPLTMPATATTFSFVSPLKNKGAKILTLSPPLFSPTPEPAKKRNRYGPTPKLKSPSIKDNPRVLFADNLSSTTTRTASRSPSTPSSTPSSSASTRATTTAPASPRTPTPSSPRTPNPSSSSSRRGRRRRSKADRIRGGGGGRVTIDPAKFADNPAYSKFSQRFEKATSFNQVVDCCVDFISSVASSNNSNNSVTSRCNMLVKVAKPRKLKEDSKPSSQRRYIRTKSKDMYNVLSAAVPNYDVRKDILSYILEKKYNADIYFDKVKQQHISVTDCIAIRMRGGYGVSNSAVNKMLQDVVKLFKHNNMLRVKCPLPGSLRAKMGKAESNGTIPVDYQVIRCSTAKEKTEMCVHSWIRTIPLLVEKLVATCIRQGKYEESISISNLVNKILLGIGADRGGGDLINLIRLLNRMDGNCSRYSIPLAVVEKAAEEYDVLAKTLYNNRGRGLLEPLLNDELYMFVMRFTNDAKCLAVRFIRDGKPTQPNILCLEKECECMADGLVFDSIANTRKMWNDFDISNIMDNNEIELQLNLITNVKGQFIGVRVRSNDGTSLTHRFDSTVNASKFESVDCMQVISIPIEDSKIGATIYGQSTCSVARPCLRCTWEKNDKRPTMWLSNHGFAADECHPVELRVGANSRKKNWKTFESLRGKDGEFAKEVISKDTKQKCNSISKEPLLYVNQLDKHHGEPMHVAQGILTHLSTETYKKLNEENESIDGDFYYEQAEACQQYIVDTILIETSEAFIDAKSTHNRIQVKVKKATDEVQKAEKDGDEDIIKLAEENLETILEERTAANEESNYGFKVRLVRGAKEYDRMIDSSENNRKTRMTKQAFLFRSAMRMYAGFFTAMHETMELTGRRGIAMLDFREKVHHFVVEGGFVQATEAIVTEVMDAWLELANHVHPISIICNDQSKLDAAKIVKFEGHVSDFVNLWIPFIGGYKNWQYYKLHTLTCGAIAFAKKYGMLGRPNAQGFENKHFELGRHREILSRVPQRKVRVQKLAQRSQTMFIDGLPESLLFLEQADANAKTGPRGKYNITVNRTRIGENMEIHEEEDMAPEGYFTSNEGNFIPQEWEQLYHFIKFGKAPAAWRKVFEDDDEIGAVDTAAAAYLQPISGGRPH